MPSVRLSVYRAHHFILVSHFNFIVYSVSYTKLATRQLFTAR